MRSFSKAGIKQFNAVEKLVFVVWMFYWNYLTLDDLEITFIPPCETCFRLLQAHKNSHFLDLKCNILKVIICINWTFLLLLYNERAVSRQESAASFRNGLCLSLLKWFNGTFIPIFWFSREKIYPFFTHKELLRVSLNRSVSLICILNFVKTVKESWIG